MLRIKNNLTECPVEFLNPKVNSYTTTFSHPQPLFFKERDVVFVRYSISNEERELEQWLST